MHILTCVSQYETAVSYYQRLLELARKIGNIEDQAKALGGLRLCYGNWGQYQKAWNYCQQQLLVLNQIDEIKFRNQSENADSLKLVQEQDSDRP